jgi:DNA invertase Pin-like site-specific DNA recombinase
MARAEVARAVEMRAQGLTVRAIARSLHVPRSTVGRALAGAAPKSAGDR